MKVQGQSKLRRVEKQKSGRWGNTANSITVSINKGARGSRCLRLGVPRHILESAGIKYGDKVVVVYCDEFCRLQRTNDASTGYTVGGKNEERGTISMTMMDDMKQAFFPNGKKSYSVTKYETRSNELDFIIGESVVED